MKKPFTKKLSAFIIVTMMFSVKVNAQIVYTDVIPDITYSGSVTYSLDLDNNGTIDYLIVAGSSSSGCTKFTNGTSGKYVRITPLNQNAVAFRASANVYPSMIDSGAIIKDNKFSFQSTANQILRNSRQNTSYPSCVAWGPSTYSGNWTANKYLGLKLLVNGQYYFGWAKLSVTAIPYVSAFTIREYAFNSIPNQPILAGETSCATPTVTLSSSGPLSFCAGDSVTLTANGTGYLYQWKKDGINISGTKSQTYVAKTAGIYKCKVTNSCGSKTTGTRTVTVPCRNTDASFVSMTNSELEHLSVFPNPATNSVTIKFPSDEEGEISIVNLFGEIVFSEKINSEEKQIDLSKFSGGMYVVRWSSGENFEMKKFSIIK